MEEHLYRKPKDKASFSKKAFQRKYSSKIRQMHDTDHIPSCFLLYKEGFSKEGI